MSVAILTWDELRALSFAWGMLVRNQIGELLARKRLLGGIISFQANPIQIQAE